MKKFFALLMISSILMPGVTGCFPVDPIEPTVITSGDEDLAGVAVTAGDPGNAYYKLFVLNEGQMGTNGAELDFLRFSDGKFVTSAYHQMNGGRRLGDVANDIQIRGNLAWIVVNNSGLVEVVSAVDETRYANFEVPAPRNICFFSDYAYVTSWAGTGADDTGSVYRIDLRSGEVLPTPTAAGWQPEGIVADSFGNIWVANSGGTHAFETGQYDDRVMIFDPLSMQLTKTIHVAGNLKNLFYDPQHNIIWATAIGDYYSIHSGIYPIGSDTQSLISRSDELAGIRFTCADIGTGWDLFVIGTDDEWDWVGPRSYYLARITPDGTVTRTAFSGTDAERLATPYAIEVNPLSEDIYITDAGDYVNPGKVCCFDKNLNLKWEAATGVCPGHMALYAIYW